MTWAWQAPLPPGPKFVLLALADIADDEGVCWPGQRSLARKCSLTIRTVQRMLSGLENSGLLLIEPRFRNDGSRSSNQYRLPIETPHDKLSWGGDTGDRGPTTPVTWPPDTGVVARTTTEPSLDTLLPDEPVASAPVVVEQPDLDFPVGLTPSQRTELRIRLRALPRLTAQRVVDELAGRMQIGQVKNPLGYCGTLMRRARSHTFTPELAFAVADARLQREQRARQRAEQEAAAAQVLRETPVTVPAPLLEALERMRRKSADSSGNRIDPGEHD